MPSPDDAAVPAISAVPAGRREPLSRRSVLRGAATASAAGFALTTLAASPGLAASQPLTDAGHDDETVPDHIADGEAVVAHVRNIRRGEIDVYRGTSHVQVVDRALAAHLARASR